MGWGGPGFVIAIIAISTAGWVINNWIRARHGYEPDGEWGNRNRDKTAGRDQLDASRKVDLLTGENAQLTGKVSRLEERIAVLERIATDPAERITRDIDALRDR